MGNAFKCIYCKFCKIEIIDDTGYCEARCVKKTPPKKGKILYWAFSSYRKEDDNSFTFKESGDDRVIKALNDKKKEPSWCPLLWEEKDNV